MQEDISRWVILKDFLWQYKIVMALEINVSVQPTNRLNLWSQKNWELTFCHCHVLDVIV